MSYCGPEQGGAPRVVALEKAERTKRVYPGMDRGLLYLER